MLLTGQNIHFMGVGGIGVSALAEMAQKAGARVTGCDRSPGDLTRRLADRGIEIYIGHDASHVDGCDLLVYSSAVPENHPERRAAGVRQEKRGQFLARFMSGGEAAGVSGTHGKTTTSWLLAHLLIQAGRDPSVFIGGIVPGLPDGNFRVGKGPFVAELDESDESFLLPKLTLAVITNIESDHLSHYGDDAALFAAFRQYAAGVAGDGLLIACLDNPGSAEVFRSHAGRKLSYGFAGEADIRASHIETDAACSRFAVQRLGRDLGVFSLALPGRHNIANALAALAAALELGADVESLRKALPVAGGVERRLERLGRLGGAVVYSDYAHHPTEISATIGALRQRHAGGILVVFQPHLFSRTRDYTDAFGAALAGADAALVADIYPAREEPIPGVTAELVATAALKSNSRVSGPAPLRETLAAAERMAGDFEAVVFMGAGDIDKAARELVARAGK